MTAAVLDAAPVDTPEPFDGVDVAALLAAWDARICARCGGARIAIRTTAPTPEVVPCRDCCCPCGAVTGGGLCNPCDEAVWLAVDDHHRILAATR
jgi:hypothetical protein